MTIPEIKGFAPGPWKLGGSSGRMITTVKQPYYGDGFLADADTLANAELISLAPTLYERVRELEKENERLRGLIKEQMNKDCECETCENRWNKFKTKHNL